MKICQNNQPLETVLGKISSITIGLLLSVCLIKAKQNVCVCFLFIGAIAIIQCPSYVRLQ